MIDNDILIVCASWEDRFLAGIQRDLDSYPGASVKMFYYEEYSSWTVEHRAKVGHLLKHTGSTCEEMPLRTSTPIATWKRVQLSLAEVRDPRTRFIVDCSTMPRELLWFVLGMLGSNGRSAEYVYHRPETYCSSWLSREPLPPRLVLTMSGIARIGRRTALVIAVGYDTERVANLLRVFEPSVAVLLLQSTSAFSDNPRRMQEHRERFARFPSVKFVEVDSYDVDSVRTRVQPLVVDLLAAHNVLLASLGPKLSALSLYEIHRDSPEAGLIYTPAKEFNREYSKGIGEAVVGHIDAPSRVDPQPRAMDWLHAEELDLNSIPDELLAY
jgi:hypothetical protein